MKSKAMKIILSFFLIVIGLNTKAQERNIFTTDSVSLYVNVKGSGTPCLYIHGGPGSGSYWVEKFFGNVLEQHFQMIYLDQRGVGRSTSPKDHNYSMERMVKDFEEVRNALGIKQWLTLGHSFGGILQMGYSERHPKIISGMLMINCTLDLTESFNGTWIPKACEFLDLPPHNIYTNDSIPLLDRLMGVIGKLNEKDLKWKMAFADEKNSIAMDASYDEIPNWNNDFGNLALSIKEYWNNYKPLATDMKMPVLFFTGDSDWVAGPENYKGVNFPNIILYKSNVGHIPFMENKGDLEKAIIQYIKKYNF